MKKMNRIEFNNYRRELIVKELKKKFLATANEIITSIWVKDIRKGYKYCIEQRGWKFHVHLNKQFSMMEKAGLIKQRGYNDKGEKLWEVRK